MQFSSRRAFMFAGQGTQYLGMGLEFHDRIPNCRDIFALASEIAGMDLVKLCRRGPIDRLTRTDNLQITLTTVNICAFEYATAHLGLRPDFVLGHSVGEIAALYATGVLSLDQALRTALARGRTMQAAATAQEGSMVAVMGPTSVALRGSLHDFGEREEEWIACYNSPTQHILSGERARLDAVAAELRRLGAQATRLTVSGAWHSSLMQSAAEEYGAYLDGVEFSVPRIPLVMNTTAAITTDVARIKSNMKAHLIRPVQWVNSIRQCIDEGVGAFVELGPKRVLSRLCEEIARGLAPIAVESIEKPRCDDGVVELAAIAI
jgi:[acyl-carrier-protein] S-malonyltransferase